jgi:hypothetical protein
MIRVFDGRFKKIRAFCDPQGAGVRVGDGGCVLHEQFAPQPENVREVRRRM